MSRDMGVQVSGRMNMIFGGNNEFNIILYTVLLLVVATSQCGLSLAGVVPVVDTYQRVRHRINYYVLHLARA